MEMSVRQPVLQISQSTLVLTQPSVDKPCFQLLMVTQEYASTPVTIETDSPEFFLLATDSQPNFGPVVTFVPSAEGTYVHVRYSSLKRTLHRGQLIIKTPYTQQTVEVEGRTAGLLATVQQVLPIPDFPRPASDTPPAFPTKWVFLLVAALVSGLGYAGFLYRCAFFPSLCQTDSMEETVVPATPVNPKRVEVPVDKPKPVLQPVIKKPVKQQPDGQSNKKPVPSSVQKAAPLRPARQPVREKPIRPRKSVLPPPETESELERELNGRPF